MHAGVGLREGQVENQVGLVRERFFTPRLRFKSYAEMNAWLEDRCVARSKQAAHPELKDRTVWEVFEAADGPALIAYRGPFDGFHALSATLGAGDAAKLTTVSRRILSHTIRCRLNNNGSAKGRAIHKAGCGWRQTFSAGR